MEELGISDYPITMRLNANTPEKLLRRIAEVMRHGGGIVALYNEPLILRALEQEGYGEREARSFANDGCWEIPMPGRTNFSYSPFDGLQILNRVLNVDGEGSVPDHPTAEALYQAYLAELDKVIHGLYKKRITDVFEWREGKWRSIETVKPSAVVSLFEDGCLRKGQFYDDLGPDYTLRSPHIGDALETMLSNLRKADSMGARTRPRCILLKGVNLNDKHLSALAELFHTLRCCEGIELLPYHTYGDSKNVQLGRSAAAHPEWIPGLEQMDDARTFIARHAMLIGG